MKINTVLVSGNLTADPQATQTTGGTMVCNFTIAHNGVPSRDGASQASFFAVTAFGKQAEIVQRLKKKGDMVVVEGSLVEDRWKNRETGENRSRIKIIARNIQFAPRRAETVSVDDEEDEQAVMGATTAGQDDGPF